MRCACALITLIGLSRAREINQVDRLRPAGEDDVDFVLEYNGDNGRWLVGLIAAVAVGGSDRAMGLPTNAGRFAGAPRDSVNHFLCVSPRARAGKVSMGIIYRMSVELGSALKVGAIVPAMGHSVNHFTLRFPARASRQSFNGDHLPDVG